MSRISKLILNWGLAVTAVVLVLSVTVACPAWAHTVNPPEPIPVNPTEQVAGDGDGIAGITVQLPGNTGGSKDSPYLRLSSGTVRDSSFSQLDIWYQLWLIVTIWSK